MTQGIHELMFIDSRLKHKKFPIIHKGKGKGKAVPVLKLAPRHEDVLREWRYSSTHS
jgi:hypothetical protein